MGEESKWYGYLQSLPTSVVPNALFWGHDDAGMGDHDGREARAWLDGTEVEKEFCDEHGVDTVVRTHPNALSGKPLNIHSTSCMSITQDLFSHCSTG